MTLNESHATLFKRNTTPLPFKTKQKHKPTKGHTASILAGENLAHATRQYIRHTSHKTTTNPVRS